ncbi:SDR family NAD(P)-dependent oxidoreductase [Rhodococcus rhodnii]|uniref:Short-chained dehydrogenase n=2 Tax=Rhodococcus rhodnii TaxID=38312 RepID=R7WTM0_9NOCA|nr:SDR family NAD(P)-dependent oxidoreductase [Rhodococcus rhodnii]EOM77489.1 short-chained dehydrogenase [Rhodococcus rhodnii LMG 5362]TXG92544.1 SDR family NAD(P)-dependent oxidoreductase [Rhodococcus rhodnii]
MSGRFAGRRAIVTGASRGIGAAIAQRLAAEGAAVAIVARTVDDAGSGATGSLRRVAALIEGGGGTAASIGASLEDPESRGRIVPAAEAALDGPIDILVNNAAAAMFQPLRDYPAKRAHLTFEVNVHAPLTLSQQVIPGMREQGEGWIVNIGSGTSRLRPVELPRDGTTDLDAPIHGTALYGMSKAAQDRMTAGLAAELAGTGIRVNSVRPRSAVATAGALSIASDMVGSQWFVPESLEEMTEAVVFVCDCAPTYTGRIEASLDILEREGITALGLDGTSLST